MVADDLATGRRGSPPRASVIAWAPPAGNGQPTRWPRAPMATPNAVVNGRSSGRTAWAASPAKRAAPRLAVQPARRRGRRPQRREAEAGQGDRVPGDDSGDSRSSTNGVPTDSNGAISRRHAAPSAPSPAAVSSTERCRTRRAARQRMGERHVRVDPPHARELSSGSDRRAGRRPRAGWIAEQTSWRKPGSVSSAVRHPPPGVGPPPPGRATRSPACEPA